MAKGLSLALKGEAWVGTRAARPFEQFSEIAKRCTVHVMEDLEEVGHLWKGGALVFDKLQQNR
ncbi:MAG: hypothetical protein A3C93_04530 [Candidatus Lloydbacteria bacterium RIFCSPHIGHO2_02_FULL_54_17]|uniref:Uncharacterized protein n=1 Tax=Candidatus Lloydbacteria bacterium RIFCSPHIGHO2_02_FULL_54_17 TaxID=1798664 RepID=A0A1G2DEG8_9BACT|nr:MAG: hypothetical protein A3C93_04530 [Candidatus Lloydbacteria bacterium RIFCSPHIGHO2_02_FULL_54_17]OGZ16583.1 MAG: hypothetical protein A3H76_06535 [Candidatus Lloydbacteria bacterium RIFCSPLOWO2_02_FULL_54_12]